MQLASIPLFDRLFEAKSVLIAGAGGGYDVFAGLPIYFALRDRGIRAHLGNLSFTHLDAVSGERLTPSVVTVTADSEGPAGYFPEGYLARFLASRGDPTPVHAFEKRGVVQLREAYEAVCERLSIDTVLLADGGTDSLLTGDEAGLGTPSEDMASIAAVDDLAVRCKLLVSIGFGIDAFHGVCHHHVLENIAALSRDGAYLGAFSLLAQMPELELSRQALACTHAAMPQRPSIVGSSIVSAVEGAFGDVHSVERTRGSQLFINPLMALYFAFDLPGLARRVRYLEALKQTQSMFEIAAVIEAFQRELRHLRPATPIPL